MRKWEGVFSILMSAYTKAGGIDAKAMRSSIDYLIRRKIHGLIPLGSFGENPYLSEKEKKKIIDIVVDHTNGKLPVIVGTGCISTDETIAMTKYAEDAGADGFLICMPTFWSIKEEDIIEHYKAVAAAVEKPIFLYNFPHTTHIDLTPELVIKLAGIENVVGIKESIGDMKQIKAVIDGVGKKTFSTFVGFSSGLLETLKLGGAGCFCPVVNTHPEIIVGIYNAFKASNTAKAEEMHKKLMELAQITRIPGLPDIAARKEVMRAMGIPIQSIVKRPLAQLTEEQKKGIWANVKKAGLLNAALVSP